MRSLRRYLEKAILPKTLLEGKEVLQNFNRSRRPKVVDRPQTLALASYISLRTIPPVKSNVASTAFEETFGFQSCQSETNIVNDTVCCNVLLPKDSKRAMSQKRQGFT